MTLIEMNNDVMRMKITFDLSINKFCHDKMNWPKNYISTMLIISHTVHLITHSRK